MTRDLAVATFVVWRGSVLLLLHRKLGKWLPPGGHVEANELPDEAAVREVFEETGVRVELVGERGLPIDEPRQLVLPRGIQVERIAPDHEHIDMVYFARPIGTTDLSPNAESLELGWYGGEELERLPLTDEIRLWVNKALKTLAD